MKKVYVFMADGFEDIEALIPIDVLRRGDISVTTVSINATTTVNSAHGVPIVADTTFGEANFDDADLLMLPGGLPGATNLDAHQGVCDALCQQVVKGKMVSAICAAPMVLGRLGLLKGKRATCYPGCEKALTGAEYTHELCTVDGLIVTGEGPAASLPYAYTLLEMLADKATAQAIADGMMFTHLMNSK